jgi:hypothetical protein
MLYKIAPNKVRYQTLHTLSSSRTSLTHLSTDWLWHVIVAHVQVASMQYSLIRD